MFRRFDNILLRYTPRALLSLLILSVLASNSSIYAAEWEFQGFTIAESTQVFERTAISTAGEPNPNNQGQLATKHNTLDYMSTMVEPQVVIALAPCVQSNLGSMLWRLTFRVSDGGTKRHSSIPH